MTIKDFLKPSFGKLLLTITFTALASFLMYGYLLNNTVVCQAIDCDTVEEAVRSELLSFYIPLFLIFGYVVACGIVWGYRKTRGNPLK